MTSSGERFDALQRPLSRAAGAAILLALLILLGYGLRQKLTLSPDKLLAKAYTEERVLELRMGRGLHSPMRRQRGQQTSGMNRPQSLLEAEAAIARGLRNSPEDSSLLAARGQANLLEWSYEAAITDLQEALDSDTKSPRVLNGLATAYFERAEAESRFDDYGTAFELQSRALQFSPEDPTLLFNRAITGERLYLFKQSIEDWGRYLNFDSSGDWADEAKQRLSEVQAIVDAHDQRTKAPLLTPAEFVREVDPGDPKTWDSVELRIEEYLSTAITNWLPAAFPVGGDTSMSSKARQALGKLAVILERNHGDSWLKDLLRVQGSARFSEAIAALKIAVNGNRLTGDYLRAGQEGSRARELFSHVANLAGVIRAQLEEVRALRLSDAAPECLERISQLTAQVGNLSYRMVQIEAQLEAYNCFAMEGQIDRSNDFATRAYQLSNRHHYRGLALAAIVFLADAEFSKGNKEAWQLCRKGLEEYWRGSGSARQGYGIYVVMDILSKREQMWHLDLVTSSQIVESLPPQDPVMRTEEYLNLAHAAQMVGDPEAASDNLAIAKDILASAPQTETTENYRLDLEIYQAWVEGRRGQTEAALARLASLKPQLAKIFNETLSAKYHRTTGEVENLAGDVRAAQAEFEAAVMLAEQQRSGLKSEMDRLSWADQAEESYRDLIEARMHDQDSHGALEVLELYRGAALRPSDPAFGTTSGTADQRVAHAIAPLLSPEGDLLDQTSHSLHNRTVLAYELLSRGLAIWVYDDKGVTMHFVEKDPDYVRMLSRHLSEICATPLSSLSGVRAIAQELYEILVTPVADKLRNHQTLFVETGDALSLVPFQVLMDRGGHYLSEEHSVVYSPGLRYLAGLRDEDAGVISAKMPALIVASSGGETGGLRPLPDALLEAQHVSGHFAAPQLLLEDRASISAISEELDRVAVFHFAGHAGVSNGRKGLLLTSGLESQTAVFDASALNGMPLSSLQLAVLSACSTGSGKYGNLLDATSLVRAFLRARVPHVVATRWDVDSRASAALMQTFYDLLLAGNSVPQALTRAEATLRQGFTHPYYWAGFDAFGRN